MAPSVLSCAPMRIVLGGCFLLLASCAFATVITVPSNYATIQAAIDASSDADEIIVSPGTYYENINFSGKNIILRSTNPTSPTIVAATIIDGCSSNSVVTFVGTETTLCALSGFSITHGSSWTGGGINGNGTLATIQYNDIYGNGAWYGGGLAGCDGTIQQNTISGNGSYCGGGLSNCNGIILQNTISQNRCDRYTPYAYGGGLYYCGGTIRQNTISGNWAWFAGGLCGCGGTIEDNIISENIARVGPGGLLECDGTIRGNMISENAGWRGVGGLTGCDGTIQDNIISGNSGGDFANGGGLSGCNGTIQNNVISGNSTGSSGGGLSGCGGTIQDNTISGNSAFWDGGGLLGCGGTIQNNIISGNSTWDRGGGGLCDCPGTIQGNIICGNGATFGGGLRSCGTVQQNIISSNTAQYGGGLDGCSTVRQNTICDNTAEYGGGLSGCGTIEQNIISGNTTAYYYGGNGGGLYQCNDIIENNVIYSNHAPDDGGGLYDCDGAIQNNTILENSADEQGGGLAYCNGIIRNCIIWQNTAPSAPQLDSDSCSTPTYSCIQDWTGGGAGNISSDPQLVDPDNGDFHLLLTSPCIDAGGTVTLAQDFDGDPRPVDGVPEPRGDGSDFDIGADEFTTRTTLTVFSPYDSPVPPVGENLLTSGSLVTAYMTSPIVPIASGTRQVCAGWLGEGSVPASGTISTTTFVLDQPSTITWLWSVQYYLAASVNPLAGGSVTRIDGTTPATDWYDDNSTATVLAVAAPYYQFDNWSGDLFGTNNPEQILMDSPKSIVANFHALPTPTPTPSPTPIPTPTPPVTPLPLQYWQLR